MRNKSGFSLLEMMVVLGIIAILGAIVVPNIISYRNNQQVSRATRDVYSVLQVAKSTAIRDDTNVLVQFTDGTGTGGRYWGFVDSDGDNQFGDGIWPHVAGEGGTTDVLIETGTMPPDVQLTAAFAGAGDTTRFTSLGLTTGNNGTVTITNGIRTQEIRVNAVGGIRIE